MSHTSASAAPLLRLTVASRERRVDVALPGTVPVAELLPELARSVGVLEVATLGLSHRLVGTDGRVLTPGAGLVAQGVEDGALLSICAAAVAPEPKVYDDVAEAMADAVDHGPEPWPPLTAHRIALGGGTLSLVLAAVALALQEESCAARLVAAASALALLGAAIALSRRGRDAAGGVLVAWLGGAYAAVAGLSAADRPTLGAGAGLLVAGLVGVVGLARGRPLVLPLVVVGAVLTACGGTDLAGQGLADVLAGALVIVVLAGRFAPGWALSLTSTDVPRVTSAADVFADGPVIDPDAVRADARTAHEILLGASATTGLLFAVTAPFCVGLGAPGVALAVCVALVLLLGTRRHRSAALVRAGLIGALLGLVGTALAVLDQRIEWRPVAAATLLATGGALLLVNLAPSGPSIRRTRLADLAETTCLVVLLPLLVVATGVVGEVAR